MGRQPLIYICWLNSANILRYDWPLLGFNALLLKIFPSIAQSVARKVWVLLVCLSRRRMTWFKLLGEVFWTNLAYMALRQQKVPSWAPLWALLCGLWPSERCWDVLHRSDSLLNEHVINRDFCSYKLPCLPEWRQGKCVHNLIQKTRKAFISFYVLLLSLFFKWF